MNKKVLTIAAFILTAVVSVALSVTITLNVVKPNQPASVQTVQGQPGEKGDTGTQGIQGEKGDTGTQGIQGEKGDTGPQGIQGEKGDTGAQGPAGSDANTTALEAQLDSLKLQLKTLKDSVGDVDPDLDGPVALQIDTLSLRIDQLSLDIQVVKAIAENSKSEADRANARIDSFATN